MVNDFWAHGSIVEATKYFFFQVNEETWLFKALLGSDVEMERPQETLLSTKWGALGSHARLCQKPCLALKPRARFKKNCHHGNDHKTLCFNCCHHGNTRLTEPRVVKPPLVALRVDSRLAVKVLTLAPRWLRKHRDEKQAQQAETLSGCELHPDSSRQEDTTHL